MLIGNDLVKLFEEIRMDSAEKINSGEIYTKSSAYFKNKIGFCYEVAKSLQMVKEGCLSNDLHLKSIREYNIWVHNDAVSMTMKLNDERGRVAR